MRRALMIVIGFVLLCCGGAQITLPARAGTESGNVHTRSIDNAFASVAIIEGFCCTHIQTEHDAYAYPLNTRAAFTKSADSSGFFHDVMQPQGTPVYAITDGIAYCFISYGATDDDRYYMSYGKWILFAGLDHATLAVYAHLSDFADVEYTEIDRTRIKTETGETVVERLAILPYEKGEVIGYIGETGNAYGPHLHFEMYLSGQRVEPTDYLFF